MSEERTLHVAGELRPAYEQRLVQAAVQAERARIARFVEDCLLGDWHAAAVVIEQWRVTDVGELVRRIRDGDMPT